MNTELLLTQGKYLSEKLRDCSIMISGATGLIGQRIVAYLLNLNDNFNAKTMIYALYRNEEKKNSIFSGKMNRADLNFVRFLSEEHIEANVQVDYIVHCAGISGGSKMHLKDPIRIFDAGLTVTRTLLDYGVKHGCKGFVYVSTYEIYGSINSDALVAETQACNLDPLVLRNSYAEVKRCCESLGVAYASAYGMNFYSGRLTSTFGTGVSYDDPRFFAEFARCIVKGRNIVLKSTGGTVRNYLDADDAASAFLYILVNGENCNAYNLTNMDNAVSIRDIATKMLDISGNKVELVFDIAEDVQALGFRKEGCTLMDAHKLESLGWKPVYTIEESIKKLIESMNNSKRQ